MMVCKFSCDQCQSDKIDFVVRERGRYETTVEWIENAVRPAMARAHAKRAPQCLSTKADLYIPAPSGYNEELGKPTKH
jgi:hypothetical protein